MIVIATNNGHRFLPELIGRLEEHGTGGHDVLLVDTGSSDPAAAAYLESLPEKIGSLTILQAQTPYKGYDTGAYLWAYRNFVDERYIFLQDSLLPKSDDWVQQFESRFSFGVGVVPWLTFPMQWDDQDQFDFVEKNFGTHIIPTFGVFGPIFAIERWAMDRLEAMNLLQAIPSNKNEQQAMERGWSVAFARADLAVRPINPDFSARKIRTNRMAALHKRLPKRA